MDKKVSFMLEAQIAIVGIEKGDACLNRQSYQTWRVESTAILEYYRPDFSLDPFPGQLRG
jgi:hypothetical protein